jgi:rhodanese-related sulfurtransferase
MHDLKRRETMTDSSVLAQRPADRETAMAHLRHKLSMEVDPWDVYDDLKKGERAFVVLDARSPELYAQAHVPGAVNLPHRLISPETVAGLPKDKLIVTYCDGVGCNASTKAALKLADLGFAVKEMVGGIDWWRRDGHPIHSSSAPDRVEELACAGEVACGC